MSPLLLVLASQAAQPEGRLTLVLTRPARESCADAAGGDVVVCGERAGRYRLPLPREREPGVVERGRGEAASPLAAMTPGGRCGIFAGERRCGRAEAADYGYGQGRDPITVVSNLGRALLSPDREP